MREFELEVGIREHAVDGEGPWYWPAVDIGAWEGPSREFPQLKQFVLPRLQGRRTCVQAGGCCGMFPRLWARDFETVYTFEPDPLNFHCLVRNCQLRNIFAFNAGLSDYSGLAPFCKTPDDRNRGMHQVIAQYPKDAWAGMDLCAVLAIDNLGIENVDYIQLDVEASELRVVKGALRTIMRDRPIISLETVEGETQRILTDLNYHCVGQIVSDQIWCPK